MRQPLVVQLVPGAGEQVHCAQRPRRAEVLSQRQPDGDAAAAFGRAREPAGLRRHHHQRRGLRVCALDRRDHVGGRRLEAFAVDLEHAFDAHDDRGGQIADRARRDLQHGQRERPLDVLRVAQPDRASVAGRHDCAEGAGLGERAERLVRTARRVAGRTARQGRSKDDDLAEGVVGVVADQLTGDAAEVGEAAVVHGDALGLLMRTGPPGQVGLAGLHAREGEAVAGGVHTDGAQLVGQPGARGIVPRPAGTVDAEALVGADASLDGGGVEAVWHRSSSQVFDSERSGAAQQSVRTVLASTAVR